MIISPANFSGYKQYYKSIPFSQGMTMKPVNEYTITKSIHNLAIDKRIMLLGYVPEFTSYDDEKSWINAKANPIEFHSFTIELPNVMLVTLKPEYEGDIMFKVVFFRIYEPMSSNLRDPHTRYFPLDNCYRKLNAQYSSDNNSRKIEITIDTTEIKQHVDKLIWDELKLFGDKSFEELKEQHENLKRLFEEI